jgi:hypothetical protein
MTEPNIPIERPSAPIEPTEVTLPSEARENSAICPVKKQNPVPVHGPHFKVEEIELALRKTRGRFARATKLLGCSPRTIGNYCDKHPELRGNACRGSF